MPYDAIILAGGQSNSELRKIAPYDNEALIIIGNYPMIYYVYQALRKCSLVRNIVISGPVEALRTIFAREENIYFASGGDNAVESFSKAVEVLREKGISSNLLVMPTDIPFITTEAIEDFIRQCKKYRADFFYPVTSKEVNEARFPGVSRTYVNLREGVFTGGNLFIIKESIVNRGLDVAVKLVERRKNPLALAKLFGLGLVWKYLTRQLTITSIEKKFYQVTGLKGKAIISPYAEVGVDVDKPSDLELANQYLAGISF
ncbi:nucleotidyltransferase family protein [Syntrophomonas erecta]